MGMSKRLHKRVDPATWLCKDCKVCGICGKEGNEHLLLLCDGYDGAIHTYCCTPPLAHAPQGDFYCESCGHLRSEDEAAKQQELLAGAGTSGEDSGAATRSRDK